MQCAGVMQNFGYYDEALTHHWSAIKMVVGIHGDEHRLVAESSNNMALACSGKGEMDRALEFHNKSLAIKLKVLGVSS